MTVLARRLRLLPKSAAPIRKPGTWGPLAEPVDPTDTLQRMRAQSLLSGFQFRDGSTCCPPLSLGQARDVLAWATHVVK